VYEQDPDAFCLEPQTHPIGCISSGAAAVVEPGSELALSAQFIWNAGEGAR
jgi:galactose mutarotase-like enzyme